MDAFEFDQPQFLEPAHRHDPNHVAHVASIPVNVFDELPPDPRESLFAIQESTSVAFASLKRLRELVSERFHRLIPAKNQDKHADEIKCRLTTLPESLFRGSRTPRLRQGLQMKLIADSDSEPAFFNYVNHLRQEKEYFFEEALPDWKHKALRVDFGGHHETPIDDDGMTLQNWFGALQNAVDDWTEEAEDVDIPDFEETVAEYRVFQAKHIKREEARNERNRRRKTILDLERPDFNQLEKVDSGVMLSD